MRHRGLALTAALVYAAPIGAGLTGAPYAAVVPFTGLFFLWILIMRAAPFRDGQGFVLPTLSIEQSFQPAPEDVHYLADRGECVKVRGEILPVYPLTEGLQQWEIRGIVQGVLETHAELLEETFDPAYLQAHDLWPIHRALSEIHFPTGAENLANARREARRIRRIAGSG